MKFRHGRATVTIVRGGSQALGLDAMHSNGTRNPERSSVSSAAFAPASIPAAIPLGAIWPWLLFVPLLLLAIYFVGVEEGATSIMKGMYVHEFVHDGRHLLGFPCH